jgi:hypothetical protein
MKTPLLILILVIAAVTSIWFSGDTRRPGWTRGRDLQDFGAGWYVVSPTGQKIERDGSS